MLESIGISEISMYVPSQRLNIDEMSLLSEINKEILLEKVGVRFKPILPAHESVINMAIEASKSLLLTAPINPLDIDYIVYCSTGLHDKYLWSPAAKIQQMIGARNAFSFEVNNGCNAGNLGINLAVNLLKCNLDKSNVLVVVCDALSRVINHENKEHMCLFNFSDAAAAILIRKGELKNNILAFSAGTISEFVDHMSVSGNGSFVDMVDDADEDKRLSAAYKTMYISMIRSSIKKANSTIDKIDHLFVNQGDHKLIKYLSEILLLPKEKIHLSYQNHGHMGGSDVFFALNRMQKTGNIKPNEIIVLASSAVGFSWGATVIRA
jgi:3-oxoacyl-[acyl-carrier-protein] synthase III